VRCCEEQDIALHRDIAFALAVADLLELPNDLPLIPAVTAAISTPTCLSDPASLAHLKAVALSAVCRRREASDAARAVTSDQTYLTPQLRAVRDQDEAGGATPSIKIVRTDG
jgi:hypothetical protein